MVKNEIKENSTGIQAGRDISITQNKYSEAIESMIIDILQPSILQVGEQLKSSLSSDLNKSIGNQIRNIIEAEVLSPLKNEINTKNIAYHVNNVKTKVENRNKTGNNNFKDAEYEISKIDLFGEWIENVENISDSDKLLSKIWEEWLVELSEGKSISKHKIYLEKMKELTSEDAEALLKFNKDELFGRKTRGIEEYIYRKLNRLELVQKDYTFQIIYAFIMLIGLIAVISFVDFKDFINEFSVIKSVWIYFILGFIILPVFMFMRNIRYKLTWLGREIVSFSKKEDTDPSNE